MANSPNSFVEFSTSHLPEKDRIPYWREHYAHILLRADLEPARDVAFEASITSLSLPALQLITTSLSPARISRTGQYLADGNDDIVLCVNRTGFANVTSGGREQSLGERQAVRADVCRFGLEHQLGDVDVGRTFQAAHVAVHTQVGHVFAGLCDERVGRQLAREDAADQIRFRPRRSFFARR